MMVWGRATAYTCELHRGRTFLSTEGGSTDYDHGQKYCCHICLKNGVDRVDLAVVTPSSPGPLRRNCISLQAHASEEAGKFTMQTALRKKEILYDTGLDETQ